MLEIPAGTIDRSEPPIECTQRELQEETGYSAKHWETLGHIYPAGLYQ